MRSYFSLASPFNQAPFFLDSEQYDSYTLNNQRPSLILDFCAGVYASRPLGREDFKEGNRLPTLVLDFENNYYGG